MVVAGKKSAKADAAPKKKSATAKHSSSGDDGVPTFQKIIDNVNYLAVRSGDDKVPRPKVFPFCGFKAETGSYKNALTTIRKKEYGDFDKDFIWLYDLGKTQAKQVDMAKSNEEQLERAKQRVSAKGKKMLDILSDGAAHARAKVALKLVSDPEKRSWLNFLSLMKKEGVLEYCSDEAGNQALRLPDWLFPFGRPE